MNINQLKSLIGEFEKLVKDISNDVTYIEKMLNYQHEIYYGFYEVQATSLKVANLDFDSRELDIIDIDITDIAFDDEFQMKINIEDVPVLIELLCKFNDEIQKLKKMINS